MSKRISFNSNLIYFIVLVMFVIVRICSAFNLFDFLGNYVSYYMSLIVQILILFLIPFFLIKKLNKIDNKNTFKFLNFNKISLKVVLLSFILGAVVFVLNIYVSSFFNTIIQFFGYTPATATSNEVPATWWTFLLNLFCTAILPAFCEETLHRGMLLKGNSSFGMRKAILISGFLFGLLHLNIEQFFYASIIGLFLGYLCWICNSIFPCMIIHFMNNALSVFISYAGSKGWGIGNIFSFISNFLIKNPIIGFVMMVLILVLLVMLATTLVEMIFKNSISYNFAKNKTNITTKAIRQNYLQSIENLKKGEYVEESQKRVIYINASDFVDFMSKQLGISANLEEDKTNIKFVDLKIKILLYGSFILSGIITFITFILGLLR